MNIIEEGDTMKKISFFILIIFSLAVPLTGYATPLTDAVEKGGIGAITKLLDKGADINEQDDSGMTALGWAALLGNAEIARSLIDKGADIDATIAGLEKSASAASERKDYIWNFGASEVVTMLKEMKR